MALPTIFIVTGGIKIERNKNKQKHLPLIGVGPLIVMPQLVVTVLAIILSEMEIIYSLQIKALEIPFFIIGIMLILFGAWLWFSSNFNARIDDCIKENHLVTSGVYSIVRNPIYSAFFSCMYRNTFYRSKYCFICPSCCLLCIYDSVLNKNRRKMAE